MTPPATTSSSLQGSGSVSGLTPELEQRIKAFLANQAAEGESMSSPPGPDHKERIQQQLRYHAQGLRAMLGRLAPFGLQLLVSGVAYGTGLCVVQVLGATLRVSCVTPLLAPCLGAVGVGASSALSGHMSRHARRQLEAGKSPLEALMSPFWKDISLDDVLLDAVSGLLIFKAAGGSFRRLLPSDLRAPGALGYHHVPTGGSKYADPSEKRLLTAIYQRDGCHHCGSRRLPIIGDHIPPNKVVADAAREAEATASRVLVQLKSLLDGSKAGTAARQVYYAQCQKCMKAQSNLLRHERRSALVFHRLTVHPGLLPGLLVGFRYMCDVNGRGGSGSNGAAGPRKDSGAGANKKGGTKDKQPGIWSWVTRMEEQPGQDVFCSFADRGLATGQAAGKAAIMEVSALPAT